jgi:hypothetical protein
VLVKKIQTDNTQLDDIPYNFLIGGDGKVYEGRGFEYEGQHSSNIDASEYNSIGICIAFIGKYETAAPSSAQVEVLSEFIDHFVSHGKIYEDYKIFTQDDLMYTSVKATALKEAIDKLTNFYPRKF